MKNLIAVCILAALAMATGCSNNPTPEAIAASRLLKDTIARDKAMSSILENHAKALGSFGVVTSLAMLEEALAPIDTAGVVDLAKYATTYARVIRDVSSAYMPVREAINYSPEDLTGYYKVAVRRALDTSLGAYPNLDPVEKDCIVLALEGLQAFAEHSRLIYELGVTAAAYEEVSVPLLQPLEPITATNAAAGGNFEE